MMCQSINHTGRILFCVLQILRVRFASHPVHLCRCWRFCAIIRPAQGSLLHECTSKGWERGCLVHSVSVVSFTYSYYSRLISLALHYILLRDGARQRNVRGCTAFHMILRSYENAVLIVHHSPRKEIICWGRWVEPCYRNGKLRACSWPYAAFAEVRLLLQWRIVKRPGGNLPMDWNLMAALHLATQLSYFNMEGELNF